MHETLHNLYHLTKHWKYFHRACALIVLYVEVPLIRLLFKLLNPKKILLIVPRHSLRKKDQFNVFMSDIDLSVITRSSDDFESILRNSRLIKKLFLNLGELEIHLPLEWEILLQVKKGPATEIWDHIFQVRKLSWQREKLLQPVSDYESEKVKRGMARSLRSLNQSSALLEGRGIFPCITKFTVPPETEISSGYFDDYFEHYVYFHKEASAFGMKFENEVEYLSLRALTPQGDQVLQAPWEKIRYDLLQRERIMSLCQLRILSWNKEEKKARKVQDWITILDRKISLCKA